MKFTLEFEFVGVFVMVDVEEKNLTGDSLVIFGDGDVT
jgi:hypothetical protein